MLYFGIFFDCWVLVSFEDCYVFCMFGCYENATRETMGESFRSRLVFLFKKILDLNSCEFWFLILFLFFLFS